MRRGCGYDESPSFPPGLAAEVVETVFVEAELEEGARVDTGRSVSLIEDLVAAALVVLAAEEVVEADLVKLAADA